MNGLLCRLEGICHFCRKDMPAEETALVDSLTSHTYYGSRSGLPTTTFLLRTWHEQTGEGKREVALYLIVRAIILISATSLELIVSRQVKAQYLTATEGVTLGKSETNARSHSALLITMIVSLKGDIVWLVENTIDSHVENSSPTAILSFTSNRFLVIRHGLNRSVRIKFFLKLYGRSGIHALAEKSLHRLFVLGLGIEHLRTQTHIGKYHTTTDRRFLAVEMQGYATPLGGICELFLILTTDINIHLADNPFLRSLLGERISHVHL